MNLSHAFRLGHAMARNTAARFLSGEASNPERTVFRLLKSIGADASSRDMTRFNRALGRWVDTGKVTPKRMSQILEGLRKKKTVASKMTVATYNPLIACYGSRSDADAAQELFEWLEVQHDKSLQPDGETYLKLLNTWKRSGKPVEAESLLVKLVDRVKGGRIAREALSEQHFNVAIASWASSQEESAFKHADSILALMKDTNVKPNDVTYNSLIQITLKHEADDVVAALQNAERLLEEMKERGISPNCGTYLILMAAWGEQNNPQRVEELLLEQKELYQKSGNYQIKPIESSYTTVLQAWSRAGEPERALGIFNEWTSACKAGLVKGKPKTQEFCALIQAWVRSGRNEAGQKAEFVLQQMFRLSQANEFDCRPDVYAFTGVFSAYAKSPSKNSGQRSWLLFNKIRRMASERPGDKKLVPDLLTYNKLISALARSKEDPAVAQEKVKELLVDLRGKSQKFWHANSTNRILRYMKEDISSSQFENKIELLSLLGILAKRHSL
mmetsp:Transcript_3021/g.8520  ORF Transcript_3021/g.8520 Transcript_3021/m.8520 type:complete len:501 (-) Transcript_3021:2670-4172(-)